MKMIDSSDAFGLALISENPNRKNKDVQEIIKTFKDKSLAKVAERIFQKAEKELKSAIKTKIIEKRIKVLQIPKGYWPVGEKGWVMEGDLVASKESKVWLKVRYWNMPVSAFRRGKDLTFIRKN